MEWIERLKEYYQQGTEGIKIIYICTIASVFYWCLEILTQRMFGFGVANIFLLSAHSINPYVWTIFTFSFIHESFISLFFVMLMLYFTERIFRIYFNGKSFVKFFILGNLLGGVVFLLFSFLTGKINELASGSVFGVYSIIFATISYNPKMEVSLFPLPFKFPIYILGIIILGMDIFVMAGELDILAMLAGRIGAAAFGYFYMKFYQTGNDFLGSLVSDIKKIFNRKPSLNAKRNYNQGSTESFRPKSEEQFNMERKEEQKITDTILDKISKNGYDSLTRDEKDFLFKSSKK